jgi:hypothetical protein
MEDEGMEYKKEGVSLDNYKYLGCRVWCGWGTRWHTEVHKALHIRDATTPTMWLGDAMAHTGS